MSPPPGPPGKRDARRWRERAETIVSAASGSVLEHGYDATTVERIARDAGVAKGTVYLHFTDRDALFDAVIERERHLFARELRERMDADPAPDRLGPHMAQTVRTYGARPLLRALMLRDRAVLGRLARERPRPPSGAQQGFGQHLVELHEAGLVRTDRTVVELTVLVGAVFLGFFELLSLAPDGLGAAVDPAELLADTVVRALDRGTPLDPHERAQLTDLTRRHLDRSVAESGVSFRRAAGIDAQEGDS